MFAGYKNLLYICSIIHNQKQNKMEKKFVIQCATTKHYFACFPKSYSWKDDFLLSSFYDSEEEAKEFIERENKFGAFIGKSLNILAVEEIKFEEIFPISLEEELDNPNWDVNENHPDYETKYRWSWLTYASRYKEVWHTFSQREKRMIAHFAGTTQGWF